MMGWTLGVTEWMTGVALKVATCDVWRRMLVPLALFLSRWVRSTPSLLRRRAPRREDGKIVSAGVAMAVYHAARFASSAGSSSWTPREKGLRVLAGSGEKTLSPPGESSLPGDTQSARADSAPTPSCGTARIATERKLNTPHSPNLRPARPGQSIGRVLSEIAVFICPLRNLTPTPKSACLRRACYSHPIAFISCHLLHYNPLTP